MKIMAIIQARMGSTRLPAKVMQDLAGATMLARVVKRTQRAMSIHEVVVATTQEPSAEAIVTECSRLGVKCLRGSTDDVLDRYYQIGRSCAAETIVRITSDCPFIDPEIIDLVVGTFTAQSPDYASNIEERSYPRGLDTEIMSLGALTRAWSEAKITFERAHVTPYIRQHPELFKIASIVHPIDYSMYRWTVDTPEDFAFALAVYKAMQGDNNFSWQDMLRLLECHPEISDINREVRQKSISES